LLATKTMKIFLKIAILLTLTMNIVSGFGQSNTLNQTDENGLKQGYWIIYFTDNPAQKKSEGKYVDGKKEGVWKTYFPSGQIKQEITYINNSPNGYAKIYYEDGKVSEEGIWKGNKWVGEYKFYHKNGQVAYDWNYNNNGKREGEQKYFYENGNKMIEGTWANGKESGTIKEYDENGKLKVEKTFNDGKLDVNTVKIYENGQQVTNHTEENNADVQNNNQQQVNHTNPDEKLGMISDGFHKTYTRLKKIDKEGTFKGGRLYSGKDYIYDSDGNLLKINIYNNGSLIDIQYNE